jgi:hypothetical protein
MKNVKYLVLGIVLLSVAGFANAGATVTVVPSLCPDGWGAGFAPWSSNALTALENYVTGVGSTSSSYGTLNTPSYYQPLSNGANVGVNAPIVTSYPSWMGVANPTGAFAGQNGNDIQFAVVVAGNNGTQFALENLNFIYSSSDGGYNVTGYGGYGSLGFDSTYNDGAYGFGGINYDSFPGMVGFDYNNHADASAGITLITSGSSDQSVDGVIVVGTADAYWADYGETNPANVQADINATESGIVTPMVVSSTFSIVGSDDQIYSGSGSVNVVPAPAAVLLGIGGLSLVGLLKKRFAKKSA